VAATLWAGEGTLQLGRPVGAEAFGPARIVWRGSTFVERFQTSKPETRNL